MLLEDRDPAGLENVLAVDLRLMLPTVVKKSTKIQNVLIRTKPGSFAVLPVTLRNISRHVLDMEAATPRLENVLAMANIEESPFPAMETIVRFESVQEKFLLMARGSLATTVEHVTSLPDLVNADLNGLDRHANGSLVQECAVLMEIVMEILEYAHATLDGPHHHAPRLVGSTLVWEQVTLMNRLKTFFSRSHDIDSSRRSSFASSKEL